MRKEIKGIGMTAEEMTYFDTPEEIKADLKDTAAAWDAAAGNSFEIEIAPIEEWARAQLAALGFKDGDIYRVRSEALPHRAGSYAAQVLRHIQIVRKAIADNNAQEAARFAVDIGKLFDRIQATIEWEKFALRGKNIAESKRGPSRLYREAVAILERKGRDTPVKEILKELEDRGLVEQNINLHWSDDRGREQTTTPEQFASRISQLR